MPFEQSYKEIYLFLTRGVVVKKSFLSYKKIFSDLLVVYSFIVFIVVPYIFSLGFLFFIFKWDFPFNGTNVSMQKKGVIFTICIVAIVGPIVEELGFRSWLVYSKRNFSLLVFFTSYFILNIITFSGFYTFETRTFYKILISFTLFSICYLSLNNNSILNESLKSFWTRNKIRIIYISIFLFSFIHILNFPLSLKNLSLMPLITFPQTIYGVFLGFVRLKYGIIYSILLHSVINFAALIPVIFRTIL